MSTSTTLMTAEKLLQLPRGQYRYELINGELKTMSPSGHNHGRITVRLTVPLANFVWDNELGEVFGAETGFKLTSNPDTVLAPDISFITKARIERGGSSDGYWNGPPIRRRGAESKRAQWTGQSEGIAMVVFRAKQVWVVNQNRTVVVHELSEKDIIRNRVSDGGVIAGLSYSVGRIFEL